jgi:hypothetical protein
VSSGRSQLLNPRHWAAAIVVFILASVAPFVVKKLHLVTDLNQFNDKQAYWLQKPASADPSTAYLRGKVLPFGRQQAGGPGVDEELFWALPSDLRPRTPDEVDTVVWLDWTEKHITTPQYAWRPYWILGRQRICKVTVIDKRTNKKLASRTFVGPDPTAGTDGKTIKGMGPRPDKEILNYLLNLPRKPGEN